MKLKYLFVPKPEAYEEGKIARLGLVFYWLGTAVVIACTFAEISILQSGDGGAFIASGAVFFLFCRAILFILTGR